MIKIRFKDVRAKLGNPLIPPKFVRDYATEEAIERAASLESEEDEGWALLEEAKHE